MSYPGVNEYVQGQLIRVSLAVTDTFSFISTDPSVLYFELNQPGVAQVTYTYGIDPQIVRDALGQYHIDIDTSTNPGLWTGRWYSLGTAQGAQLWSAYVAPPLSSIGLIPPAGIGPTGPAGPAGPAGNPWPFVIPPAGGYVVVSFNGVLRMRHVEHVNVVFTAARLASASWPTFGITPFDVVVGAPVVTDSSGPVNVSATSITATGCVLEATDAFTGSVSLIIEEVLSSGPPGPPSTWPYSLPSVGTFELEAFNGVLRLRQCERATAVFTGVGNTVSVTWPDFQSRAFGVVVGAPVVTDSGGPVTASVTGVTSTGCIVEVSDTFTGHVDIAIEEILS